MNIGWHQLTPSQQWELALEIASDRDRLREELRATKAQHARDLKSANLTSMLLALYLAVCVVMAQ